MGRRRTADTGEVVAGPLEGLWHPPVLHQGLLQRRACPREIAPGSSEQAATSRGGGDGPWSVEGSSLALQTLEERFGLLQPAQGDEGLDRVRQAGDDAGLR